HNDARLGSAIVRVLRPGTYAAQRTEVDDEPVALPLHQARRLLAAEKASLQVDRVDEVPILLGDLERVKARESRRVVDQAVEPSQALLDLAEHAHDLRHRFQVGAKQFGAAAFLRSAARLLL